MWFNNALIYQYELNDQLELESHFQEEALKPCPPHARFIYGWLPVLPTKQMLHEVMGSSLICLGKEERILPRGVIKKLLQDRVQQIEESEGRQIKRAEKAQIAEDLEFELLPKSFCVQKRIPALLDKPSNFLIINSSSNTQAAQLTSFLRKTIPGISINPLATSENLGIKFAQWITQPQTLPTDFQLASDCILFGLQDEKKRIHCKGYELPAEEIINLLSQGMATAELSLVWKERIRFTLNQDFVLKRLKSLDYLEDEFNEISDLEEEQQQDAALALMAGELRELIKSLLIACGNTAKETALSV